MVFNIGMFVVCVGDLVDSLRFDLFWCYCIGDDEDGNDDGFYGELYKGENVDVDVVIIED